MMICFRRAFFFVKFLLLAAPVLLIPVDHSGAQTLDAPKPVCGTWQWEEPGGEDRRIKVTPINEDPWENCRNAFRISNETDFHGFGGYTLETTTISTRDDVEVKWIPSTDPNGKSFLLPPLNTELYLIPSNRYPDTSVYIQGEATVSTLATDFGLFSLRAAFAYVPSGCLIPDEQLFFAALRASDILKTSAQLSLDGDLVAAKHEFQQVLPEFYEKSGDILNDIGFDCAVDLFQSIIKKPLAMAKIGAAYLGWIPVFIFDYVKHQGTPVELLFTYSVETEILTFYPSGISDGVREGSCWTSSIVADRPDAWCCDSSGYGIQDPCFSIAGDDSAVTCGASPMGDGIGYRMNLTEPLPAPHYSDRDDSWWILELANGTYCTQIQGTALEVDGKLFHVVCGGGYMEDLIINDKVWIVRFDGYTDDPAAAARNQMLVSRVWR